MLTITPFINTKGLVHPIQSERATYWDYYILLANSMVESFEYFSVHFISNYYYKSNTSYDSNISL